MMDMELLRRVAQLVMKWDDESTDLRVTVTDQNGNSLTTTVSSDNRETLLKNLPTRDMEIETVV